MNETKSITGSNKSKIDDITQKDIDNFVYEEIPEGNMWRIDVIKEITDGLMMMTGWIHS